MAKGADAMDISLKLDKLKELCKDCTDSICRQKEILVVSHVDADGLTAAAIICAALDRHNIDYKPLFFRQLDENATGGGCRTRVRIWSYSPIWAAG